jgi:glycerate kinase
MKTKKELEYEEYAKKYHIEIIAVCRNCGEHWATIGEHQIIKHCETCGKYSQLEHFMRPIDVIDAIKRLEAQVK